VREEIAFGLENLGVPRAEMVTRIEAVMSLLDLANLADRSPFALSGGQQQRLALASVIVMRPRVLVLDEPTSQLDPISTRDLFSALESLTNRERITVVLATQKLEWVGAFADRVVVLDRGAIVADGSPQEVLASEQLSDHGLRPTRYTQVARRARAANLVDGDRPLPVTLQQAAGYLS
jgi:energy-coupling factor transporter ATP-binding protein EcfA2